MDALDVLDGLSRQGSLVEPAGSDGDLRCQACAHRCLIRNGHRGICQVRFNQDGVLKVPWGYVAGLHPDPIEKKPFSHVIPGSLALTFGMLGCDFHCDFCQNWFSSQVGRDPGSDDAISLHPEDNSRKDHCQSKTSEGEGDCLII